jgi:glycosyltransferase involved in cell wall biosynthesis
MSEPLLTVLMTTFNSQLYIKDAVNSILSQTYDNFRFLIIDDGSTDETNNIVKSFSDKRILHLIREHHGISETLNYGINEITTEYIARMDPDDVSAPGRLYLQLKFLNENPEYDVVGCNIYVINSNGRIIFKVYYPEQDIQIKKSLLINSAIPHPAAMMRKMMFDKIGMYDKNRNSASDYDLWLRGIPQLKFYNLQNFLFFYRKYYKSSTGKYKNFKESRTRIYFMMKDHAGKIINCEKLFSKGEFQLLNTKFLVRHSPHFEFMNIFRKQIPFHKKIWYLILSLIPPGLRTVYFFYNPKLRAKYLLSNLFYSGETIYR